MPPRWRRHTVDNRRRRALLRAALLVAAWSLCAWGAARALIVKSELARADTLVVLGGSSTYVERARWAAQLFKEGRAPKIILTNDNRQGGWSNAERRNPLFVERAVEELRRASVPAESIEVLPQAVSSTYEEALLLREHAAAHNLKSLLVVTSAYHSRRALWVMRRVLAGSGVEVGISPVAPGGQTPSPGVWWLRPRGWDAVAAEYPKLVYYWLCYH
jgi:uncharacterized SAM-binding protein YcdF (DUF218 family)